MPVERDAVLAALSRVKDPELGRSIVELKMVRDVQVQDGTVTVAIALTAAGCPLRAKIEEDVRAAVAALPGVETVTVEMTAMTPDERRGALGAGYVGSASEHNHVKRIVAVMSGKGGVGKSLVAGLLAAALARDGYRVGLLDADVTGPSIPRLFGLHGPVQGGPLGVFPLQSRGGVDVMSFNLLLEREDQPVIWRGPMIGRAIQQLWGDVLWGDKEYLLVDLPPGTSDAALAVLQSLPLSGILMVTTPQGLAAMIVRKGVFLAQLMSVPISGVIENMAYFTCPETGVRHEIFGPSHAHEVTEIACAPLLARLPIDPDVVARCDAGQIEDVHMAELPALMNAFLEAVPL